MVTGLPIASGSLPDLDHESCYNYYLVFANFLMYDDVLGQWRLAHIHHQMILHLSSKFQLVRPCGLATHSQTEKNDKKSLVLD